MKFAFEGQRNFCQRSLYAGTSDEYIQLKYFYVENSQLRLHVYTECPTAWFNYLYSTAVGDRTYFKYTKHHIQYLLA